MKHLSESLNVCISQDDIDHINRVCPNLSCCVYIHEGELFTTGNPDCIIGVIVDEFLRRGLYIERCCDPHHRDGCYEFSVKIHRNGKTYRSTHGELYCMLFALIDILREESSHV